MRITRDNIYNQFVPGIEPRACCPSGERVTFETLDALFGMGREIFFQAGKYPAGFSHVRANPGTGPLWVEGALPGDVLEVLIHDIRCEGKGFFILPNSGPAGPGTIGGREFVEFEALESGELLEVRSGRRFPASPMIGVIGTASIGERPWFTTECGDHGGNMDNNAICAGACVYLPVFTEGGLLGIGDVHAAMGDGEVFGQGVEICAEVDVTVTVRKDMNIKRPFVLTDNAVSAAAAALTMEEASRLCVEDMRVILENHYGLTSLDAAMAIALFGDLKVCQIVNAQKSMRMELPLKKLSRFFREPVQCCENAI